MGLDDTNANTGNRNLIKTKALEKNSTIKILGCPCHVLHNAAMKKASTAFAKTTKFDIEDHCVDLHYWFNNSSKQKSSLEEYCVFCDTKYAKVIRYASTSWLDSKRYVYGELQKYLALDHTLNEKGYQTLDSND